MRIAFLLAVEIATITLAACGGHEVRQSAPYTPLHEIESTYGSLITIGNHPTPDQNGTGELLGLFRDTSGTVWGLPLQIAPDGGILGCAPRELAAAKATGSFPRSWTIIGAANKPTGWRGGTGELVLLLRDGRAEVHFLAVDGAPIEGGNSCWAPPSPGPKQQLHYYRLVPR